jgi:predicted kinase
MMDKDGQKRPAAALIIVGGFAGSGKTAISRRLSSELHIPRLGSDTFGRAIKGSAGIKGGAVNAYWIAYDLLFALCDEYMQSGVSAIVDLTMGWEFQWQRVDTIIQQHPQTLSLPIILRCPYQKCIERTRQRHEADPRNYDPPEVYETDPRMRGIWEFLQRLDRSDAHWVDADKPIAEVYEDVKGYLSTRLDWL